jgi:hypothetical protein
MPCGAQCLSRLDACPRGGGGVAFDAYEAALDREKVAADVYAELMSRVGHLPEIGLARQLAYLSGVSGA